MERKPPSVAEWRSFQKKYSEYIESLDTAELSRLSVRQALVNLCGKHVQDDNIKLVSHSFGTDHHGALDQPADSLLRALENIVRTKEQAEKRNA